MLIGTQIDFKFDLYFSYKMLLTNLQWNTTTKHYLIFLEYLVNATKQWAVSIYLRIFKLSFIVTVTCQTF